MNKEYNHTVWSQSKNIFRPFYLNNEKPPIDKLPVGLYEYNYNMNTDESYLTYKSDKFFFQHEIYKIDDFNEIVLESYQKRGSSTGVLFNGKPGTGKTVHAKLLANNSNLPIVYIAMEPHKMLLNFITKISQPVCWVFDEFEKYNINNYENVMLSVLDGMGKNDIPHLFIFTTNSLNINDRFLCRPSRIRYIKTFDTLPHDFFVKYIKSNLNDQNLFDNVMSYVKNNLTIDVVKSVVEEVNTIGFRKDILDTLNVKPKLI